jgi:hypothetical protein
MVEYARQSASRPGNGPQKLMGIKGLQIHGLIILDLFLFIVD